MDFLINTKDKQKDWCGRKKQPRGRVSHKSLATEEK